MQNATALLTALHGRGFKTESVTAVRGAEWYTFHAGTYIVRVVVVTDDAQASVHVLTLNGVEQWKADLSGGTPVSVVTAMIDLAVADAMFRFASIRAGKPRGL